jgi:hypothetical protein
LQSSEKFPTAPRVLSDAQENYVQFSARIPRLNDRDLALQTAEDASHKGSPHLGRNRSRD